MKKIKLIILPIFVLLILGLIALYFFTPSLFGTYLKGVFPFTQPESAFNKNQVETVPEEKVNTFTPEMQVFMDFINNDTYRDASPTEGIIKEYSTFTGTIKEIKTDTKEMLIAFETTSAFRSADSWVKMNCSDTQTIFIYKDTFVNASGFFDKAQPGLKVTAACADEKCTETKEICKLYVD